ncbi:Synaptobrevin-1, partial [Trichinella zimbabwensis]
LVKRETVWSSSSFFHILISHFVAVTLFIMSQPNFGVTDGQAVAQGRPQSKRLQQTQAQVDEVVGIMKVNVEKVLERDAKLSQLDDRADALQEGASQFEKSAATLKRKYWWKNCKMIIIICAIVLIIIIIIVVWATK